MLIRGIIFFDASLKILIQSNRGIIRCCGTNIGRTILVLTQNAY